MQGNPLLVLLERCGQPDEQLLRLELSQHPFIAPLMTGRHLEMFVASRPEVGDEVFGYYHRHTPVVMVCLAGHVSLQLRWVDAQGFSRHFVVGLFLDKPEALVLPSGVHYQATMLSGHSCLVSFRGVLPVRPHTRDEVQDMPRGYDHHTATPPEGGLN